MNTHRKSHSAPPESPARRSAVFTTRKLESGTADVLVVDGELDFTNVDELVGMATTFAGGVSPVVIDLSNVEFFGSAGFAALHRISDRYTAVNTSWAVVPSRNVSRVLGICDTGAVVPLQTAGLNPV